LICDKWWGNTMLISWIQYQQEGLGQAGAWGLTVLHIFLSFSVVSLFVDWQINPFRPCPN